LHNPEPPLAEETLVNPGVKVYDIQRTDIVGLGENLLRAHKLLVLAVVLDSPCLKANQQLKKAFR
jgi:hypothetical protein